MKISTVKGHLTATNKKHIKAIFDAGLTHGIVNRIEYSIIEVQPKEYEVTIYQMGTAWCELKPKKLTYKATFKKS